MLLLDGLGPQLPLTRPFLHFPADEGLTLQHLAKLLSQSADLGNVDLLLLFFPVSAKGQHHLLGFLYRRLQQFAFLLEDTTSEPLSGQEGREASEDGGGEAFGKRRREGPR